MSENSISRVAKLGNCVKNHAQFAYGFVISSNVSLATLAIMNSARKAIGHAQRMKVATSARREKRVAWEDTPDRSPLSTPHRTPRSTPRGDGGDADTPPVGVEQRLSENAVSTESTRLAFVSNV